MHYVDKDGKQRRAVGFHLKRVYGTRPAQFYLLFLVNSASIPVYFPNGCKREWEGWWNIPLEYGGRLATTARDQKDLYSVTYHKAPLYIQQRVQIALQHIKEHGTPMQNDEPIY